MHKITLKNKDAYDLALVISSIVNENTEDLDFKSIIRLQTLVSTIKTVSQKFIDDYEKISNERNELVKVMQKKIAAFRKSKLEESEGKPDESFKQTVESYANAMTEDLNSQIREEISPKFDELYDLSGEIEVFFEIEDESQKVLVDNFEKYAKKKYTNKSTMIDVYKAIGGSI